MTTTDAIAVLSHFALQQVKLVSASEQVEIYKALSVTLDDPISRQTAKELSLASSRTAALQMELQLSSRQPD